MQDLIPVIESLTNLEYLNAIKLSKAFHSSNQIELKCLTHFKKRGINWSNTHYYKSVYNKLSESKKYFVKKRLLLILADALISNPSAENSDPQRKHLKDLILVKKFMFASAVLYNRLANVSARGVFDHESEKIAKKNDFVFELYEIYTRIAKNQGFSHGITYYKKLLDVSMLWRNRHLLSEFILSSYLELILDPKLNNPYQRSHARRFLSEKLDEIDRRLQLDKYLSPKDEYLLLYLRMEGAILSSDYISALRCAKRQLQLYNAYTSLQLKSKLNALYLNLSQINALAGNLIGAEKYALAAINKAQKGLAPWFLSHELSFIVYWNQSNLLAASQHLQHCLAAPETHGAFRISKYRYYAACVEFARKNYKEALKLFSQHFDFQQDKMGYATWVRIMQILCLVETGNLMAASSKTAVLERQYIRLRKKEEFPPRMNLIIKLLLSLDKKDFRPSLLRKTALLSLRMLREKKKNHSWQPFTPELIRFHEWVTARKQ